jgi:hypothetical protein
MIYTRGICAALVLVSFQSFVLAVQSVTLTTAQSPFNSGITNQGWWSNRFTQSLAAPNLYTDNYLTGLNTNGATYRGFFTFVIPNLPEEVSHASLEVGLGTSASPDSYETLGLYEVVTPPEVLNSKPGVRRLDILEDLGTGNSYGTFDAPIGAPRETLLNIPLNEFAVEHINASVGNFFSVGTSLVDIDPLAGAQYVFGFTSGERGYVAKLVLHLVPEPSTFGLIIFLSVLPLRYRA